MNAFILKIIAMITMLIDHVGAVFNLSDVLRCIGRTSFPLYALMVVDGCNHLREDEKRLRKYMIFMIVMAIVSEPAFDLAFYSHFPASDMQNQLLQFATYVMGVYITEYFKKPYVTIPVWLLIIFINFSGRLGYFSAGIIYMLLVGRYLKYYKKMDVISRIVWCIVIITTLVYNEVADSLLYYLHDWNRIRQYISRHGFSVSKINSFTYLAVPFMALYNGEYGNIPVGFRRLYHLFYPAHLYLLAALNLLF